MSETVTQIPTRLNAISQSMFVCGGDDWMLECDGCGRRMPPFEPLRGLGDLGLSVARELAAEEGWRSDRVRDIDTCAKCEAFLIALGWDLNMVVDDSLDERGFVGLGDYRGQGDLILESDMPIRTRIRYTSDRQYDEAMEARDDDWDEHTSSRMDI